jgi:hypothetical protein
LYLLWQTWGPQGTGDEISNHAVHLPKIETGFLSLFHFLEMPTYWNKTTNGTITTNSIDLVQFNERFFGVKICFMETLAKSHHYFDFLPEHPKSRYVSPLL